MERVKQDGTDSRNDIRLTDPTTSKGAPSYVGKRILRIYMKGSELGD
jgi:hypothetical protein